MKSAPAGAGKPHGETLAMETFEGALPINVQVFHCHLRCFAARTDGESDAAQARCVFSFGLVNERVAVVVLQREASPTSAATTAAPIGFETEAS